MSQEKDIMIDPKKFLLHLKQSGFELASGVPCSYFSSLLKELEIDEGFRYVPAANEGEAVAIACGSRISGKKSFILIQNSGLGNALNPLTSLALAYKIPILLFISWRGDPHIQDKAHHQLMGKITLPLLEMMDIPWLILEEEENGLQVLEKAVRVMDEKKGPVAIIIKRGLFEKVESQEKINSFDREELLSLLVKNRAYGDLILTTTGFTSSALHSLSDSSSHFYMMGSMGCISCLGLGAALAEPNRRVIVIDGDGALLMHAGALAAIGSLKPRNLLHILFNNQSYESTGGQKTVATTVDFGLLAKSMGYPSIISPLDSLKKFEEIVKGKPQELTFVEVMTHNKPHVHPPKIERDPWVIAQRFSENIQDPRSL